MTLIWKLVLAAVAAIVVSCVWMSPAMALTELEEVVLCKTSEEPCSAVNQLGSETQIKEELVSGTEARFESSIGTTKCTTTTATGKTTELLAQGLIESLTFGNCKLGTGSCAMTAEHLNYSFQTVLSASHNEYEDIVKEASGNGEPQLHITCGKIDCEFAAEKIKERMLKKASDFELDISQSFHRASGIICPPDGTFVA